MQRLVHTCLRACPLDLGALTLGALLIAGCGSSPMSPGSRSLYDDAPPQQQDTQGQRDQTARTGPQRQAPTAEQIDRLLNRLDTLEQDNAQLKKQISDQYIQAVKQRQADRNAGKQDAADTNNAANTAQPREPQPDPIAANKEQQPSSTRPAARAPGENAQPRTAAMSREQLTDALLQRIAEGPDPDHVKALMAAAVSVSSTGHDLDPDLLDSLSPRTREQVARFHQMVALTYDQLAADPNQPITRAQMIASIDKVFGNQPLAINALELCRRVDSFGVYQPFDNHRFLSGRKNRMLVYVELDNFHHEPTPEGEYQVELEQQIELYDSTGETTVWRAGPDTLTDTSRNKRRDFFIVYPIELPARLTAGKYRLKVRLADKNTGSICEKTIHDIQIVADEALVNGERE